MQKVKTAFGSLALGAVLLVGGLVGGGCGQNEAVKITEDVADEVCKCNDLPCAQQAVAKASDKLTKLKDNRGTDEEAARVKKASERMQECIRKLAPASGATTP
jgi:hypothetical protein